jgi:hypothetical protein
MILCCNLPSFSINQIYFFESVACPIIVIALYQNYLNKRNILDNFKLKKMKIIFRYVLESSLKIEKKVEILAYWELVIRRGPISIVAIVKPSLVKIFHLSNSFCV